ncbi:hypothetical protein AAHB45_08970 [Pediococcus pentosaceus]|uniref:hypothetical protein n=1 Tax=Pediococcus pentosaceus TaxID=1255 RepID=UPI00316A6ACF
MGLFNKYSLDEPMVLRFSKNDAEMFKKNPALQKLIQEIGHDNRTEINAINSALPLMKLSVANKLFNSIHEKLGQQGEFIGFETIEILFLNTKGRSSKYVPYLQVKDFNIDLKYKDFTGFVFENIFNGEEFDDIDTQTKRNWAREFLDEYVKANPSQKVLAILPTEAEAEENYEAKYEGIDDQDDLSNSNVAETDKNNDGHINIHNSNVNVLNTGKNSFNSTNTNTNGTFPDKDTNTATHTTATPVKEEIKNDRQDLPVDVNKGTIKVPKFEVSEVSVAEKGYVSFKVNEKRKDSNKYLSTLEKEINLKNVEYLEKLRQDLQEDIDQQVQEFIIKNDPKKGLHKEIKKRLLAEKEVEENKTVKLMQTKCDEDVAAIQRQAEIDIEARKHRFTADVAKRKDDIATKFAKKATDEETSELQKRNQEITDKVEKLKESLVIKALAIFNEKVSNIISNGNKTGGTVFKKLANTIEVWEQGVNKEHLNAVEIQASADRAKFNLNDMSVLNEEIRKLKAEKMDIAEQNRNLMERNEELNEEVKRVKTQVIEVRKESNTDDFFKEYLKAALVQQGKLSSSNSEEKQSDKDSVISKKKVGFGKPLIIGTAVLATLGIGSLGIHEVHMDQKYDTAIQAINKKENTNKAFKTQLRKTQDGMQDLESKNSSIQSDNAKLQSQLNKSKKEAEKTNKTVIPKASTSESNKISNSTSTTKADTFSLTNGSENYSEIQNK